MKWMIRMKAANHTNPIQNLLIKLSKFAGKFSSIHQSKPSFHEFIHSINVINWLNSFWNWGWIELKLNRQIQKAAIRKRL